MIELRSICKHYVVENKTVSAIKDISLKMRVGEFILITGESGSGKSTLLNILSGNDYCSSGSYFFAGTDTDEFSETEWSDFKCRNIGYVHQENKLIEDYTVADNVKAALALFCSSRKEIQTKARELLNETGLEHLSKKKAKFLSGGERQRVAIARALAKNSQILLADEPTANLDEENAREVIQLLKNISKDRLIVVVSHNITQFHGVYTRRITLKEGRIIEDIGQNKSQGDSVLYQNKSTAHSKCYLFALLKSMKPYNVAAVFMCIIILCSMLVYSVSLDYAIGEYEGLVSSKYYQTLSSERYILSKRNKTPISKEDITAIQRSLKIKSVYYEDILLDTIAYIENAGTNREMELYIRKAQEISEVNSGRLPLNSDEIVLTSESGYPYYMMETSEALVPLRTTDNNVHYVKVVGWKKNTTQSRQTVYLSDQLMEELFVETFYQFANVSLQGEERFRFNVQNLLPDSRVPSGHLITTNESLYGQRMDLSVKTIYTEWRMENLSCESLAAYDELAVDYEMQRNIILVNYNDYKQLITQSYYQVSIFTEDTISTLEGYNIIYPHEVNVAPIGADTIVQIVFWFSLSFVVALILLIASFFFMRFIFRKECESNQVRLSLGVKRKDIGLRTVFRLAFAMIVSYAISICLYLSLLYYKQNAIRNVFVVMANIPIAQFIIVSLALVILFSGMIYGYVIKKSCVKTQR